MPCPVEISRIALRLRVHIIYHLYQVGCIVKFMGLISDAMHNARLRTVVTLISRKWTDPKTGDNPAQNRRGSSVEHTEE